MTRTATGDAILVGCVMALVSGSWCLAADQPVDKAHAKVLSAIEVMFADPLSKQAGDSQKLVVDFAQHASDVTVTIGPEFFQFTGSPLDSVLMAHYVAGAVKFDLEHPDLAHDESADIVPALTAAVRTYRRLRAAQAVYFSPFFETVDVKEQRGELNAFAQELIAQRKARVRSGAPND